MTGSIRETKRQSRWSSTRSDTQLGAALRMFLLNPSWQLYPWSSPFLAERVPLIWPLVQSRWLKQQARMATVIWKRTSIPCRIWATSLPVMFSKCSINRGNGNFKQRSTNWFTPNEHIWKDWKSWRNAFENRWNVHPAWVQSSSIASFAISINWLTYTVRIDRLIGERLMYECSFSSAAQFKYALRQHREDAKDHVVRHIGDLVLKFVIRLFLSLCSSSELLWFSWMETSASNSRKPVRISSRINRKRSNYWKRKNNPASLPYSCGYVWCALPFNRSSFSVAVDMWSESIVSAFDPERLSSVSDDTFHQVENALGGNQEIRFRRRNRKCQVE